jgi:hypothetical protein
MQRTKASVGPDHRAARIDAKRDGLSWRANGAVLVEKALVEEILGEGEK